MSLEGAWRETMWLNQTKWLRCDCTLSSQESCWSTRREKLEKMKRRIISHREKDILVTKRFYWFLTLVFSDTDDRRKEKWHLFSTWTVTAWIEKENLWLNLERKYLTKLRKREDVCEKKGKNTLKSKGWSVRLSFCAKRRGDLLHLKRLLQVCKSQRYTKGSTSCCWWWKRWTNFYGWWFCHTWENCMTQRTTE